MFDDDYISEGEAASDEDWIGKWELMEMLGIGSPLSILRGQSRKKQRGKTFSVEDAQKAYQISKTAKVGEVCKCPTCSKPFDKKSYQQAFCQTKCRNVYWNSVDPVRRDRAKHFNH